MAPRKFEPFGQELALDDSPQFIRVSGPGGDEEEEVPPPRVPPAETTDLTGQIRQILGEHLNGAPLDQATAAIEASVAAAPARVSLPEIKLTPAAGTETEPPADAEADPEAAEPAAAPTIELVREEDRVRHVIVNCSCGQTIGLDCDY